MVREEASEPPGSYIANILFLLTDPAPVHMIGTP